MDMKLGVFTPLFANLSFEDMLDKVQSAGLNTVEIGTGGNPGSHHCPTDELLESEEKRAAYLAELEKRNLTISAFSCHNNPISPIF
jgi:sugar phosphate isomerase/epimerase